MAQFKIQINYLGCGISVFEKDDYQGETPDNLFVSYTPSTGVVVFNAIEDGNSHDYLVIVACSGQPELIKQLTLSCEASTPAGPTTPISPSTPVSSNCIPNYAIGWNYGTQAGGTAICNDSLDCSYFSLHQGTTRLVSINTLSIGGRVLKYDCSPFSPSVDGSFRPVGCNVFTILRPDLSVTYAVVVLDSDGYIIDIHNGC